ncbi:hypothetical protein TNCV_1585631 [Trichonephila clavipes]|nr:hypothetical protein TNCV_1585631 [Trichonephila clavipes]
MSFNVIVEFVSEKRRGLPNGYSPSGLTYPSLSRCQATVINYKVFIWLRVKRLIWVHFPASARNKPFFNNGLPIRRPKEEESLLSPFPG